ncbi:MAG: BMP family ABC transporter substrate-binding protein [Candidatus Bipolaricaulota bacterium]|nr:BMP family ABC transporter substrate-binding protein [Candidatus Bipolaricaulota bacterium]
MKRLLAVALVLVLGLSVAGLAAGKVAVVLDVGGRGDLAFNDMGFKGTDQAAKDFGLEMVEVQCATGADYLPNIRNLSRTGEYDLIICVGFLLGDALAAAATEFPNQKFAIIDVGYITGPNIMNFVFRENEMSALVGALAALSAAQHGYTAAGIVLGIEIPVLWHFEAGFRFGMDWGLKAYAAHEGTMPAVNLLYTYTGTFSDIALGKAASEAMLAQGAVGIYNVAGPLGVGDLEAVTEVHDNAGTMYGPPYYYGVDADQDWMGGGKHGIASGMKRVDTACYMAVEAVVKGTFTPGVTSLGLAEGGVSISNARNMLEFIDFGIGAAQITAADAPTILYNWQQNRLTVADWIWDAVAQLEQGILDNSIFVPTADTGAQIATVRAQYTLGAP